VVSDIKPGNDKTSDAVMEKKKAEKNKRNLTRTLPINEKRSIRPITALMAGTRSYRSCAGKGFSKGGLRKSKYRHCGEAMKGTKGLKRKVTRPKEGGKMRGAENPENALT